MNQDDLRKYKNLSPIQTVVTILIDPRGIHLCFFDRKFLEELPNDNTIEDVLPEALFVMTVDPGEAMYLSQKLVAHAHSALHGVLPIHHAKGAPFPFPPDIRYVIAGVETNEFDGFEEAEKFRQEQQRRDNVPVDPRLQADIESILRQAEEGGEGHDAPAGDI